MMARRLVLLLLQLLLCSLVACEALPAARYYTEVHFTVPPNQKHTVAQELHAGQVVRGTFTVSGADNAVEFYIEGPGGELAYEKIRAVGTVRFEMKAEAAGTYTLYFDNSSSFGSPAPVSLRFHRSRRQAG